VDQTKSAELLEAEASVLAYLDTSAVHLRAAGQSVSSTPTVHNTWLVSISNVKIHAEVTAAKELCVMLSTTHQFALVQSE